MTCFPKWHRWKIVDKEILPSLIEQFSKGGATKCEHLTPFPERKACIVTYRCGECGAEKVERI